jgi:hypothetical protein
MGVFSEDDPGVQKREQRDEIVSDKQMAGSRIGVQDVPHSGPSLLQETLPVSSIPFEDKTETDTFRTHSEV